MKTTALLQNMNFGMPLTFPSSNTFYISDFLWPLSISDCGKGDKTAIVSSELSNHFFDKLLNTKRI
jgi:hypothetical protein